MKLLADVAEGSWVEVIDQNLHSLLADFPQRFGAVGLNPLDQLLEFLLIEGLYLGAEVQLVKVGDALLGVEGVDGLLFGLGLRGGLCVRASVLRGMTMGISGK